ncbi:hypothetical protein EIN_078290 [Entamoeba invadens IP1]|uniref:Uncharacterized protein n=1 Tax=Entamoeba invadens IP1 TaxID=370355 RepID=A0A0A1TWB4_ENTIV|nr:hypothetical protein EIN_078290 [Entamoeba invadens IP1]ELP83594.1 hypothetical protein EIN_078290 [Entamoeba invadens IP1]|eukprot:XP_004182940.1 hypothetical protein EIN_078290 [Entamoeba invadens IP1]
MEFRSYRKFLKWLARAPKRWILRNEIQLVRCDKSGSNNELENWINFLLYRDWKNIIKPDYSIWEESIDAWTSLSVQLQYYGFTQIQGDHGLLAAAMMEEKYYKDTKRAELLRKRAQDLSTSFEKLFWNKEKRYFVQAIWTTKSDH